MLSRDRKLIGANSKARPKTISKAKRILTFLKYLLFLIKSNFKKFIILT